MVVRSLMFSSSHSVDLLFSFFFLGSLQLLLLLLWRWCGASRVPLKSDPTTDDMSKAGVVAVLAINMMAITFSRVASRTHEDSGGGRQLIRFDINKFCVCRGREKKAELLAMN